MTDSDILEALEGQIYVSNTVGVDYCNGVPKRFFVNILDLINRQKAEIERLNEENKRFADIGKMYSEIKSEAIKEFAEKVLNEIREAIISNDKAIKEREEKHNVNRYEDNFCSMCDGKISALGGIRYFINNLAKEMVGE